MLVADLLDPPSIKGRVSKAATRAGIVCFSSDNSGEIRIFPGENPDEWYTQSKTISSLEGEPKIFDHCKGLIANRYIYIRSRINKEKKKLNSEVCSSTDSGKSQRSSPKTAVNDTLLIHVMVAN